MCGHALSSIKIWCGPIAPCKTSHRLPGSDPYSTVSSTRFENVQWCTTAQQYATRHKDSFPTKSIDFCFIGGIKVNSVSSPGEDSTRITLSGTFRLITQKNMPSFLWCPQLMFSAPQYPLFPAVCRQRHAQDWTPDIKNCLCKTAVDCFPGNSSSRPSSKVMSKLRNRCLPISTYA
ncbi:hypothetical protein TNCV_1104761 [Trichonephila clavipes]|nr:hypothetical protein TNCV_1104761 [Trichonephila clavipes]